jgi:hypothetical protein
LQPIFDKISANGTSLVQQLTERKKISETVLNLQTACVGIQGKTFEGTTGRTRPELVNSLQNSLDWQMTMIDD